MEREMKQHGMLHHVARIDAHHRTFLAMSAGVAGFFLLAGHSMETRLIISWNAFAVAMLLLSWVTLFNADPKSMSLLVTLQDSSRSLIFVVLIIATSVSFLAVGFLLGPAKGLPPPLLREHVLLSVVSIVSSWTLMHTIFALRYAHHYYTGIDRELKSGHAGGLDFPGGHMPDYLDFAYFSFVIGMTCQVSDVQISSRHLRRLALLHGALSFGFNTAVLALSVNVVSGML
jgi:uncharacterized membrane protein